MKENQTPLLSEMAANYFKEGDYDSAAAIYKRLSADVSHVGFDLMVKLCLLRSEANTKSRRFALNDISSIKKIAVFTNLNLSVIDGSTVFIANICKQFSESFDRVFLVATSEPCSNILNRLPANGFEFIKIQHEDICGSIFKLDQTYDFDYIFVRSWGDANIWFDRRYSQKTIYYWPLHFTPDESSRMLYSDVGFVAFQTALSREQTFLHFGEKKNILLPPIVQIKSETKKIPLVRETRICYIGTIRPECYSLQLLELLVDLLSERNDLVVHIAVGKIFYKHYEEKKKVSELIVRLEGLGCNVEYQASPERCDEIAAASDISFSLWEPTPENANQISTKFLESYFSGCRTICFRTGLYSQLLGGDYPYFIDDISELKPVIYKAASDKIRDGEFIPDRYVQEHFTKESHAARLNSALGLLSRKQNECRDIFNAQFDCIYGLYIDDEELENLKILTSSSGLAIRYFKGINGRVELASEYKEYMTTPLDGAWELAAKKKRLTPGAFGHLASFISIVKDAKVNKYKKILILESDAILHSNMYELNVLRRPLNFKVLYLGAGRWNSNVEYLADKSCYYPRETTGTFGIAFDCSVFDDCLAEWEKFKEPTDIALWRITDKFRDECFVINPNLIIADVTKSKTTGVRSQLALSAKFNWSLDDYLVQRFHKVNQYVARISFSVNLKLRFPVVVIQLMDREVKLEVVDGEVYEVGEFVIGVIAKGLFLTDIKVLNRDG